MLCNLSHRTDTSDDDFEHLSLDDQEEVPAFFHEHPPTDTTSIADSELGEVDAGSVYAESSTTKGKEMVREGRGRGGIERGKCIDRGRERERERERERVSESERESQRE